MVQPLLRMEVAWGLGRRGEICRGRTEGSELEVMGEERLWLWAAV